METVKKWILKFFIGLCFIIGANLSICGGWLYSILAIVSYVVGYIAMDFVKYFGNSTRQNNTFKE